MNDTAIIDIPQDDATRTKALEDALQSGLRQHNASCGITHDHRWIRLAVTDTHGATVAGLSAESDFGWLHIRLLWVHPDHRGKGLATKLMEEAHLRGRHNGATRSYLCTFDFQAEGFYSKLGYEVFGTLHDFPPGHRRVYFQRAL